MKTVYAIPGMNTTKELFDYLSLDDVNLKVLEWPSPDKGETMQTYASRFAEQIDAIDPFYLLGVSFGGMLCMEVGRIKQPVKTILISSAKHPGELPPLFKSIRRFYMHYFLTEKMYMKIIPRSRKLIGFKKDFLPAFTRMVYSMPPNYYRRAINCVIRWKQETKGFANVVHIHGDADLLLPHKFVTADYIIEGGTHAMIVYKAKQISEIINKVLR
jgi:hypothetical protein